MLYIWDPPIRNLPKIRLRSFLHEGTISENNQPEVSYKVVSIMRVLTVYCFISLDHVNLIWYFQIKCLSSIGLY